MFQHPLIKRFNNISLYNTSEKIFKIHFQPVSTPTSTNEVFIIKLTVEDYLNNDRGHIGPIFLSVAPITSVAFFWNSKHFIKDQLMS